MPTYDSNSSATLAPATPVEFDSVPKTMRAAIFEKPGRIALGQKPVPKVGPTDALIKITLTTICGTDVHILKGEYPVKPGLVIGHEPVGVIVALGGAVTGYQVGQRVIAGAITPCGQCDTCLEGHGSQCGSRLMGGWRFGNTIDGSQAEYLLVPNAQANLAAIPDALTDEQVLMCPDIMSTGFSGAESGQVKIGDVVAVFAQGPIGLCATAGAKLRGAARIIVVDAVPERLAFAKQVGATDTVNFKKEDPVDAIMRITKGRGVDVSIEALGLSQTFDAALRVIKPGGTLSSLGVYSHDLALPLGPFAAGLGDHKIVTTLCPGGKDRMRRLMSVLESGRLDLRPLVTHRFKLDQIEEAYDLFANQRDGVLKVALTP
ncbi:MAG TPA: NAD(P)-dependent alcohol dehydrogenase [Gemmatimonadaceae bacterium]|nr:NAD(P)-dependent alcohol dehydrogenase [Gemmatimonadaceae bacterium]